MNILIVHPEGNVNNNPFLNGAVIALCGLGHHVSIISLRQEHYQYAPCPGCDLILTDGTLHLSEIESGWQCVMGVDYPGMRIAAPLARQFGARLGLISFEIFFEGEVGAEEKRGEVAICRNVDFAVAQDDVRAMVLQHENRIPRDKIVTVPLAAAGSRPRSRPGGDLHRRFGLAPEIKIALLAGSLAPWSMFDEILESSAVWPDDWRILLHSRYGLKPDDRAIIALNNSMGRILVSEDPVENLDDMGELTDNVDLGLALYAPNFRSKYTGNNLKYLGMASGKINSYLRHGLPVICTPIGLMSEAITRHRLGFVIESMVEIPSVLAGYERRAFEQNCLDYFAAELDLDTHIKPFLDAVLAGNTSR